MKDARFTIPTPALLSKVVDLLDHVPMEDRDTKGDIYEYMLGKIASAGKNGQFRTPRHLIQLMVALTASNAKDVICDPASGTCGFLVAAGEYLKDVKRLACPLPPLPLQQTVATRIQTVETLKATRRAAMAELDTLFATLQHRAFQGEL